MVMEFVENREVEKEQLKAIFRDMVKYSPSKIVGMIGNAIIIPVYYHLNSMGCILCQLLFCHFCVSFFLTGLVCPA